MQQPDVESITMLDLIKSMDLAGVRARLGLTPITDANGATVKSNPNSRDSDGSTALHWAGWMKAHAIFVALLEAGADPTLANARGETVLEWALRGGDLAILSTLLTMPRNIAGGDLVATKNAHGGQAVHIAAEEGSCEALSALALRGGDLNARDNRGKTPLMCAAHRNHPVAVQWLLRHGADPHLQDSERATCMHYAAIGSSEYLIRELWKQGLNYTFAIKAFEDQLTPEDTAIKYQNTNTAQCIPKYTQQAKSMFNRLVMRNGLDAPRKTRPFWTGPQTYFFVGMPLTLLHFYWNIQQILSAIPEFDIDGRYTRIVTMMYTLALASVIGIGGFQYMDPGMATKGDKLFAESQRTNPQKQRGAQLNPNASLLEASVAAVSVPHSTEWLVSQCLNGTANVCVHCRIVKPIRSKHCQLCGGCVMRMDHHCPWVNRCVAVSNHRSFFVIIISMLIAAALHAYLLFFYIFTYCLTVGRPGGMGVDGVGSLGGVENENDPGNWSIFAAERWSIFLMLHSSLIVICCAGLLFGQSYTVSKGMTTNEAFNRFRLVYMANNDGASPFSQGCVGNWLAFCGLTKNISFIRKGQTKTKVIMTRPAGITTKGTNEEEVVLEMNALQAASHNSHRHSHGGQACHGHGHGGSASGDSHSHGHSHASHATTMAAALNSSPPAPSGSLHLQLLNPPHHNQSPSLQQSAQEDEADCAYFPNAALSPSHLQHQQQQEIENESVGLISGVAGKDKHR